MDLPGVDHLTITLPLAIDPRLMSKTDQQIEPVPVVQDDHPLDQPELVGARLIASKIKTLPNEPGVYRMLDAKGEALYVGKAKSLRKRVPAYTKMSALSQRLKRMVTLTRQFDVITTANEVEALLLECNMIKRLRPAFNILLRDDKSFPYIYLGKIRKNSRFRELAAIVEPRERTATISAHSPHQVP